MFSALIRALRTPWGVVELFILGNVAFLAADVYIAHSTNAFERPEEWIPVVFSLTAPVLLLGVAALSRSRPHAARTLALVVGWTSLLVGVAGMLFHLQSHFFEEQTMRNLVYTAPFVAPLAYAGLGLLLILDRMVDSESMEWAQWIVFLALGGFAGNFVLSLADHAQNGFFNRMEWAPVAASALAIGFLLVVVVQPANVQLRIVTWWLLALQVLIGVAGSAYHLHANMRQTTASLWDRFVYGAPIFAPLLFANLAILAAIGLWAMRRSNPLGPRPGSPVRS
ncbi:MAG: hypothetical protein ABI837_03905 [Acidobacteriota bacterium]